ncbi:MAG TPA: MerR family transcriptional regulator [Streptosporangiaceae bacterium]|nr:MerR family transcriptional regulator [Streptosporangiaceae bacterium]
MSAQAARAYMTIGEVLGLLRGDFPDVTISKIRFLESEGLIEPARTPSGYRKFTHADVERLRFILAAQRDHYLPLRVIRERLATRDRAADPPPSASPSSASPASGTGRPRTLVAADDGGGGAGFSLSAEPIAPTAERQVALTRGQLIDGAGIDEPLLSQLEEFGLIRRSGGHYDGEALAIAKAAGALGAFGFEARHLRTVKAAAEREVGLIEQMITPLLRRRSPGAHGRAEDTAREIAALTLRLHTVLVSAGLRDTLNG